MINLRWSCQTFVVKLILWRTSCNLTVWKMSGWTASEVGWVNGRLLNVVLNRTVVVGSDWLLDNLWGSHLQSQSGLNHVSFIGHLSLICWEVMFFSQWQRWLRKRNLGLPNRLLAVLQDSHVSNEIEQSEWKKHWLDESKLGRKAAPLCSWIVFPSLTPPPIAVYLPNMSKTHDPLVTSPNALAALVTAKSLVSFK